MNALLIQLLSGQSRVTLIQPQLAASYPLYHTNFTINHITRVTLGIYIFSNRNWNFANTASATQLAQRQTRVTDTVIMYAYSIKLGIYQEIVLALSAPQLGHYWPLLRKLQDYRWEGLFLSFRCFHQKKAQPSNS